MDTSAQHFFSAEEITVFGHSSQGQELAEHTWGNKDKSILFLSGFGAKDAPAAETLLRWKNHLCEAEKYGGILGDFNLKNLRNKCKIRIIPVFNPDCCKINRNGLQNTTKINEISKKINLDAINHRGVDLNRNFNANWMKLYNTVQRKKGLSSFPESEPETAALTRYLKQNLPDCAVILRYGQNALLYPDQVTPKELKEAIFLGQYGHFPVKQALDADGTPLQWLTDRGVKVIELHCDDFSAARYTKLRDLFTMCAALT